MFSFSAVATVRTPYARLEDVPKGLGAEHTVEGRIEFVPEFAAGLEDIEGFSHLYVLWVFDRSQGFELTGTNPTDGKRHGVFATRSPRRPNPIALSVVELLGREGPALRVRGVDMLDGTPVLDVKPYLSSIPVEKLRRGGLEEAERGRGR
jgi:tRNA (adenine37-N6)-methyltransferase